MLASLTLSATPSQILRNYEYQKQKYLNSFPLSNRQKYDPEGTEGIQKIGEQNWKLFLGEKTYYWSYLRFFKQEVGVKGFKNCLETYVFGEEANKDENKMLARFYGGVAHALIHCGYGIEFDLPYIFAEGLAMATCTAPDHSWLFNRETLRKPVQTKTRGLFSILTDMITDDRLSPETLKLSQESTVLPDRPFSNNSIIQSYIDQWDIPENSTQIFQDFSIFSVLLVGTVAPKNGYHHDFFLIHLNNAHFFTPLYLELLTDESKTIFLRGLLAEFLFFWIARGRPIFEKFEMLGEVSDLNWDKIFYIANQNVDEHLPKAVRTLYVFSKRVDGVHVLRNSCLLKENPSQCPFFLTAVQLVRMHEGMIRKSKHVGRLVGADQEFWEFDKFV